LDWEDKSLPMNDNPLIDIQNITYTYPGRDVGNCITSPVAALRQFSLRVPRGEYLVILGHNGSGKSTLARHCNALLVPDEGRVLIAGRDSRDKASQRAIRDAVAMIFQNPDNQIIATVVEDDIAWALTVRGFSPALIRERVEQAMAAVGITALRQRPPNSLSGGQKQRLAIASALALRPLCIVADEATAQLDPLSRKEIVLLLHRLNQDVGLTIIHVTHLLEEAVEADRIVVMQQGRIVMEGAPPEIFSDLDRLRSLQLVIPEPIELARRMREDGIPISQHALTVEAIAEEIMH
jgi:energy-coupling factor transport system ATP-binding protein